MISIRVWILNHKSCRWYPQRIALSVIEDGAAAHVEMGTFIQKLQKLADSIKTCISNTNKMAKEVFTSFLSKYLVFSGLYNTYV